MGRPDLRDVAQLTVRTRVLSRLNVNRAELGSRGLEFDRGILRVVRPPDREALRLFVAGESGTVRAELVIKPGFELDCPSQGTTVGGAP